MDTTFKEVIYNIKNLRQSGRQSQDALLSDYQYGFIIDQYRSKLVTQAVERNKVVSSTLYQTIKKKLTRSIKDEVGLVKDCKVYKVVIPRLISIKNRMLCQGVRPTPFARSFSRSSPTSIRLEILNGATQHLTRWFIQGNTLYVFSRDLLENVYIDGVWERPLAIWEEDEEFNPFTPYDFEYPYPNNDLDGLYKMMTDAEIRLSMMTPNDITADGQEEGIQTPSRRLTGTNTNNEDEN